MMDIVALPIVFALFMIHYELKIMSKREAEYLEEMRERFRILDASRALSEQEKPE